MPHLNVFTVCERLIIDGKGIPSLINLFQRIDVQMPEEGAPVEAVTPGRWAIFCVWQLVPEEVRQDFIQYTRVVKPDGKTFHDFTQPFKVESDVDLQVRTFIDLNGFPIGQEGRIKILVWLGGDETNIHEASFYIKYLSAQGVVLEASGEESHATQPNDVTPT